MNEQTAHSAAFLRKRKFMLVLPLFVIPFMTVMFWLMGGGQVSAADEETTRLAGLNMTLPEPVFKETPMDKMSLYLKADRDSIKIRERLKADQKEFPYLVADTSSSKNTPKPFSYGRFRYDPAGTRKENKKDKDEELMEKLAALDKVLKEPQEALPQKAASPLKSARELNAMPSGDIDRLEQMMKTIHQKDTSTDPQLAQLNSIVEKLLEAQQPESLQAKAKETTTKDVARVFPVSTRDTSFVSLLQSNTDTTKQLVQKTSGFYSLSDESVSTESNAFEVEIAETQTIINSSTVKLRLLNNVYINGIFIPAQTFIYGRTSLGNGRLQIAIGSIQHSRNILPVSLTAYDLDGMQGIAVPNDISSQVAKQSAEQTMQGIHISSLDPSIGAQAMGAGIEAGKRLFSKKIKQVKIELKEGYKLLLK